MNDLRGPARWLRLGAMMGAAVMVLVAAYIGYRAWSVPDVGPPPGLVAVGPRQADRAGARCSARTTRPSSTPQLESTIESGITRDSQVDEVVARGWQTAPRISSSGGNRSRSWSSHSGWPRQSRRPDSRLRTCPMSSRTGASSNWGRRSGCWASTAPNAAPGATSPVHWDDLRAIIQISDQVDRSGGSMQVWMGMGYRAEGLQWALAWAADPHQTPATLRAALAGLRGFPQPVPASVYLKVDYALIERTFRQAESDPLLLLSSIHENPTGWPRWSKDALSTLYVSSWERERARRVVNLILTEALRGNASLSRTLATKPHSDLAWYWSSTPAARAFWWLQNLGTAEDPTNALLGRAFEQVAALRIWQLEHDGHYPESLSALVPGILPSLPLDPYSGKPFLYRRSAGQTLLPLGLSAQTSGDMGATAKAERTQPGQWLLYSVGPNEVDNGAAHDYLTNPADSDLVFPLPDR